MLSNYQLYLNIIEQKLQKDFESQKDYICCTKGCAKCCKGAEFPYTELEFNYLLYGFSKMDEATGNMILGRILELIAKKKECKEDIFRYDCPFLINDSCSVYAYRGLLCRTFGLMVFNKEGEKSKIPFCAFEGLNYSKVLDKETKVISQQKFDELGLEKEPVAFKVGYSFLTDKDFESAFNIKFGEVKPLLSWFESLGLKG